MKILYLEIDNCEKCPFYNYFDVSDNCHPASAYCSHEDYPQDEKYKDGIIACGVLRGSSLLKSADSDFIELWDYKPPQKCPLKNKV